MKEKSSLSSQRNYRDLLFWLSFLSLAFSSRTSVFHCRLFAYAKSQNGSPQGGTSAIQSLGFCLLLWTCFLDDDGTTDIPDQTIKFQETLLPIIALASARVCLDDQSLALPGRISRVAELLLNKFWWHWRHAGQSKPQRSLGIGPEQVMGLRV